jgi:diacylglycerol O-acyltransferase
MEKLSFQDSTFLRLESPERPFHVAGLMVFRLPEDSGPGYLRRLAKRCGRLNEMWPIFNRKLAAPESLRNPGWIEADDYDPDYHVFHYALPAPGRQADLLKLASRAHERLLDRNRPLWELHIIEGLEGGRFALYCKVHHALVDGVGALRMLNAMFSSSADDRIAFHKATAEAEKVAPQLNLARQLDNMGREMRRHYKALPGLSSLLAAMGRDAMHPEEDLPPLPFTAPRTPFNSDVDARREIVLAELPLGPIRRLARQHEGTINDVLVSICGGALRSYLASHDALPRKTLEAGVPVSLKRPDEEGGNQVGFLLCPFFTNESDPVRRLQRVTSVMRKAKQRIRGVSRTAAQDFTNALMLPTLLLTLTGTANLVNPALNAIVSNVPGPRRPLFLEGAQLERIYPLSVVTDGMGINITVVSYAGKLCIAITSCPTELPDIGGLGRLIRENYRELTSAAA